MRVREEPPPLSPRAGGSPVLLCGCDARRETMTRERNHPGYSLPELLLVTALLFVLAAIMLVVLEPARRMARAATCTSNLRQIGMAYKMYVADYGQYPEPGQCTRSPYLKSQRVL